MSLLISQLKERLHVHKSLFVDKSKDHENVVRYKLKENFESVPNLVH